MILHVEPDYYFQGLTGYLDEKGKAKGNRWMGYESQVELKYKATPTLSASVSLGHDQMVHHAMPAEKINETFRTEVMVTEASILKNFGFVTLIAGITQKHDVVRPVRGFKLAQADESEYFLLNSWKF